MAVLSSRAQERRSREIRGFSALARLYYLARPTKTAMLRRLAWSLSIISMPGTAQVRFKMQTVTCGLRI